MNRIKSKIIIVICVVLLIMVTGYAYFATNLDITATGNITTNWNVKFMSITAGSNGGTGGSNASTPTFTDTTATMSANLQVPGDYMEYELVLQNSGNLDAIIESIDANASGSPAIVFSISGINEGDKLAGGVSKKIKIKIEYDYYVTSQPTDTTKTLTVSIKAVQDTGQEITEQVPGITQPLYLRSEILKNNIAQSDANIDFSKTSEETGTNGLYYTSTNTEDNKTTYYFRGNVENNYVKFGKQSLEACHYNGIQAKQYYSYSDEYSDVYSYGCDQNYCLRGNMLTVGDWNGDSECTALGGTIVTPVYGPFEEELIWRIVRINEDGSIRLITQKLVDSSPFNLPIDSSAWLYYNTQVGYMYGELNATGENAYELTHTNEFDSEIKTFIDGWYVNKSNLSNYTYLMSIEAGFCNDRSIAPSAGLWNENDTALGYGINMTYYGAYNRIANLQSPQFKCPNETRDLFTISSSTKGNKKLTNPIGLLSADEVIYAGVVYVSNYDTEKKNIYLPFCLWTLSPSAAGSMFYSCHNLYEESVTYVPGRVYPVINLKSTVGLSSELPSGCTELNGTQACPYVIDTSV